MDRYEIALGKQVAGAGGSGGGGGGNSSKSGDGFIDRSKVRILLCDNDAKTSEEVFTLLCKCSYQGIMRLCCDDCCSTVTTVRSARQVIDALNAEGPDIDIILSEVDLPMAKGMKMLKYIMRGNELRRIPVIMMSAQDEVSVVVKCLRLGAADYLVKPLRTNELLNLWTHMWRRRRMLGLAEKNILSYEIDLVASDPSDANTNSTTLFSDDTDDKSRKSTNPEISESNHEEDESNAAVAVAPVEPLLVDSFEYRPDVPGISDRRTGQFSSSCPKKSELRIGESSAFFTYVKSSMPKSNNTEWVDSVDEIATQPSSIEKKHMFGRHVVNENTKAQETVKSRENHWQRDDLPIANSDPNHFPAERSLISQVPPESPQERSSKKEDFSQVHMHPSNGSHHDVSSFHPHPAYPYYISAAMNQVMMSSPAQMYQKNLQDLQNRANSTMLPQYNHIPQCPPHMPGMATFPYYPVNLCLQQGQMPPTHQWSSCGNSSPAEGKLGKVDRREAALLKFRQKRKERCFDKKIRYVNRKKLAERRPRVKGQFVRKMNGVNVDLNGQPGCGDFDDDDEEEDDEEDPRRDFSPEDDTSACL